MESRRVWSGFYPIVILVELQEYGKILDLHFDALDQHFFG